MGRRARPTDVLGHADLSSIHLARTALAPQLLDNFHDLIHTGGAHRVPARLQAPTRTDGDTAVDANLVIEPQPETLASLRETTSLK